jgi:hypothetical protein
VNDSGVVVQWSGSWSGVMLYGAVDWSHFWGDYTAVVSIVVSMMGPHVDKKRKKDRDSDGDCVRVG